MASQRFGTSSAPRFALFGPRSRFGILIGLLSVCGLLTAAATPSTNVQKWNFKTGGAPHVTVSTISGNITAVAGDADGVGVEAMVAGGDESDRKKWIVEVTQDGDEVRARACCGPCEGKHNCNSNADVSFRVRLPAGAQLSAAGVSGDIEVTGLRGRQTLSSVSGNLRWQGTCGKECRLHANTVSGDIRLGMAPQSSFGLEYGSVSGSFKDELATTVLERGGGPAGHVRAQYGKGEGQVTCNTVSGDLALERK